MIVFLRGSVLFCPGLSPIQRYLWQFGGIHYAVVTIKGLWHWLWPVMGATVYDFPFAVEELTPG